VVAEAVTMLDAETGVVAEMVWLELEQPHLGGAIRRLRHFSNLSQEGLASEIALVCPVERGMCGSWVGRWERGEANVSYRYRKCLRDVACAKVALMSPLRRRDFLQELTAMVGGGLLGWASTGTTRYDAKWVDTSSVEGMEELTEHYAAQVWLSDPRRLLPVLHDHITTLRGLLPGVAPQQRRGLQVLIALNSSLAGQLCRQLEERTNALAYWLGAEEMARAAGDGPLLAHALIEHSYLFSQEPHNNPSGDSPRALAMLAAAESAIGGTDAPWLRGWLAAKQANELSCLQDRTGTLRALDQAESALARASGPPAGYFIPWGNRARLEGGYRGACMVRLQDPAADRILEGAIASTDVRFKAHHGAMLLDLAVAHAQQGDVEAACHDLSTALGIADSIGKAAGTRGVANIVQRSLTSFDSPAVNHLRERLLVQAA
jgi:hypothetical protein